MAIVDRVKFDGPSTVLVWRYPQDNLSWGTQVIVNQSQEAVFFKGGKFLDVLGPGTHTLKTANIPLLRGIIAAPFGKETPFAAEIYFVNKAVNLDIKWRTGTPIPILDPKFNVFLPLEADGQFGTRVVDTRLFLTQLSATNPQFTAGQLADQLRGILLTKVKDYIADNMAKNQRSVLDLAGITEEMAAAIQEKLRIDFLVYGVELVNFSFHSIYVSENDETVIRIKKVLSDKAELDILGDKYQQKRTFDIMEKAASNEGGGAGAGLGAGMGLGAGISLGQTISGALGSINKGTSPSVGDSSSIECSGCGKKISASSKFCGECGFKIR